jgi:hypothetical protein
LDKQLTFSDKAYMLWLKMKDAGARKVLVHMPVQFILDYTIPISSVPAADGNAW